jgi:hypothetical protein
MFERTVTIKKVARQAKQARKINKLVGHKEDKYGKQLGMQ